MSTRKDYQDDLVYLLQQDLIAEFIPNIGKSPWQTVYTISDKDSDRFAIFSALLEPQAVEKALQSDRWDLSIGDGLPGFSQSWQDGEVTTTYHRFGNDEGIRSLVIHRSFHGAWSPYLELCEEFRHFHNLAENRQRQVLLDFDESGYEVEVAKLTEDEVKVNWSYLRQFLAATQLHLAIYFDSVRCSQVPLDRVPQEKRVLKACLGTARYSLHVDECDFRKDFSTLSRLLGKVIIAPPPIEECGKWPFEETKNEQYVSFIIGTNPDGSVKEFTSNPEALSNYFGANPGSPHYLTSVFFRREVLQKYYAEPERYSVEDGYLRCLSLWGIQIDNSHPTHVVAFLGDLGRDLPYREQLHWKQFNVQPPPPPDPGISETCFRRAFLAQFAEPESVDLIFRQEYHRLSNAWREKFGWPLFLDPKPGDEHVLQAIHIPVTNSQSELDEQILRLAKLLVDSLNEEELAKAVLERGDDEKGISKFERFLQGKGFAHTGEIIRFWRDLQRLRSTGAAHRKGEAYQKHMDRLGLTGKRGPDVMRTLLARAVAALQTLHGFLEEI